MSRKGNSGVRREGGGGSVAATETQNIKRTETTTAVREFKKAFDELERGQVFVNIPELRKKLDWSHDEFDNMLRKLRNEGFITLQRSEVWKFDLDDFFYDELGIRRGMLRWHKPI